MGKWHDVKDNFEVPAGCPTRPSSSQQPREPEGAARKDTIAGRNAHGSNARLAPFGPLDELATAKGLDDSSPMPRTQRVNGNAHDARGSGEARSGFSPRDLLSAATTNVHSRTSTATVREDANGRRVPRARGVTAKPSSSLRESAWKETELAQRPNTAPRPPKARAESLAGSSSPLGKRATPTLAIFDLRELVESAYVPMATHYHHLENAEVQVS